MKTVKIQGGLGNQLFGLAFAHSIATLTAERVRLDIGGFGRDRYGHRFMLGDLTARLGLDITRHPLLSSRLVGTAMGALPSGLWTRERAGPDTPEALEALARRGAYFDGYWQSEAYIARPEAIRAVVRQFLEARTGPPARHSLVIHCRTYADEVRSDRRGAPGADYFRRAIEAVEAAAAAIHDIALVSDRPSIAMERLGALASRVTPIGGADAFGDMALMLAADSLILGNSSFSWWGGFCGDANMVIYPRRGDFHHYPAPASRFTVI